MFDTATLHVFKGADNRWLLQFSVTRVLVWLRIQLETNFVFPHLVCSAGFTNNTQLKPKIIIISSGVRFRWSRGGGVESTASPLAVVAHARRHCCRGRHRTKTWLHFRARHTSATLRKVFKSGIIVASC